MVDAALPAWSDWQEQIADIIGTASHPSEVQARLQHWAERAANDAAINESLYQASLQADMAGQLFVRTVEVPEATSDRALAAPSSRNAFLSMPFDEALEYFRSRNLLTPEDFAALTDAAKMQAFTASKLATDRLRAYAQTKLLESLESGNTLETFAAQLRSEEISLGVTPSDPYYVENVYRTNVATAYGAGRYRQITSPAVQAARSLVEYRTAGDTRVRPNHARLNGLVFRQSDPNWSTFAPPNGYQCRCSIVLRRTSDVDPRRIVDAATLGPEYYPDPGFRAAPTTGTT